MTDQLPSKGTTKDQVPTFTHKGWFMLCPIKAAEPDSHAPCVAARWWILEPWFTVNEALQSTMIWLLTKIDPDYEPMWMFKITGELNRDR